MTDRELLEAAAKAAGYKTVEYQKGLGLVAIGQPEKANKLFDPLTSDADAFRLMVDCGVDLLFTPDGTFAMSERGRVKEFYADHNNNKHAATRRAIVRAAAGE